MVELNFLKRIESIPKPSLKRAALLFVISFILILAALQMPALLSQAKYQVTHDEDKNYEDMTEEYRSLYGYKGNGSESQPRVSATAVPLTENYIAIPKINVNAPILETNTLDEKTLEGLLKQGVLLYPGSVEPGKKGTTAIIGHSSSDPPWTKYSTVFSLLGRLEEGDLIYVHFQGRAHIYSVTSKRTGTIAQLEQYASLGDLILSSCWPIGSDNGRILITANLLK